MQFSDIMNYFYYRTSISELRAMHGGDYSPGLSYHSMLYLNIIAGMEDCTVSKLADVLKITRSGVTIKVSELVRRGFVEKKQSKTDGRIWIITLSPKMAEVYAMFNNQSIRVEASLREKYSDTEITLFGQMLREVAEFELEEKPGEN